MGYEQQKVTIPLPPGLDADDLATIGEDIVEFIRDRSELGFGVRKRGRGFSTYTLPAYTDEYEKFKGQSNVDLRLSSDMLDSLEVLKVTPQGITVGYQKGDPINGKVEGNVTGSYGQKRANPSRARNFLGMTREELDAVLAVYPRKGR